MAALDQVQFIQALIASRIEWSFEGSKEAIEQGRRVQSVMDSKGIERANEEKYTELLNNWEFKGVGTGVNTTAAKARAVALYSLYAFSDKPIRAKEQLVVSFEKNYDTKTKQLQALLGEAQEREKEVRFGIQETKQRTDMTDSARKNKLKRQSGQLVKIKKSISVQMDQVLGNQSLALFIEGLVKADYQSIKTMVSEIQKGSQKFSQEVKQAFIGLCEDYLTIVPGDWTVMQEFFLGLATNGEEKASLLRKLASAAARIQCYDQVIELLQEAESLQETPDGNLPALLQQVFIKEGEIAGSTVESSIEGSDCIMRQLNTWDPRYARAFVQAISAALFSLNMTSLLDTIQTRFGEEIVDDGGVVSYRQAVEKFYEVVKERGALGQAGEGAGAGGAAK